MPPDRDRGQGRIDVYRHPWAVRITHWVNVLCVFILVMSGLQILKAHPNLYWGIDSTFDNPWLSFPEIPGWATIPSWRDLAMGRRWHFFFAWLFVINGAIYLAYILLWGRLWRVLRAWGAELADIPHCVADHARLRFP